jgi:hypothetical protein
VQIEVVLEWYDRARQRFRVEARRDAASPTVWDEVHKRGK